MVDLNNNHMTTTHNTDTDSVLRCQTEPAVFPYKHKTVSAEQEEHNDVNTNRDLENMNASILKCIQVYDQTVRKLSKINETVDALSKHHSKLLEHAEKIHKQLEDLQIFVDKNINNEQISESVMTVTRSLDDCMVMINEHVSSVYNDNKQSYDNNLNIIDKLQNIMHIVKNNKRVCPVCLQRESTHFTVPCGHVFCENCASNIKTSCFVCRQYVLKVAQLYYV
jgi:hypothetical protein